MSAIITSKFRLDTTNNFVNSLTHNQFYMALGRSNVWTDENTPDIPYENDNNNNTLWQNMFAMKKIDPTDIMHSSPRNLYVNGIAYDEYDDQDINIEGKKYFVITDNNNVYLCIKAGNVSGVSTSQVNPDILGAQTSGVHATGSDGYIWKYMYTVPPADALKFLTSSFIPVRRIKASPIQGADAALFTQWDVQAAASNGDGAIYNVKVVSAGADYTSIPVVTIVGNGTGAVGRAILSNGNTGVVIGITMEDEASPPVMQAGTGYTHATVTLSTAGSTTQAVLRPIIGPIGGFGADPTNDLRSHYVTINKAFTGDEAESIPDSNDFRQISLIKNPIELANQSVNHGSFVVGNFYKVLTLGNTTSANNIAAGMVDESVGAIFKALTVGTGGSGMGTVAQVAEGGTYNTCKRLTVTPDNVNTFPVDQLIEGTITGAKAYVVEYLSAAGILYYMQNETTGFTPFTTSDFIRESGTSISGADCSAVIAPLINHDSGDVMFIENKTATNRNTDQVETVRLVIAF